MTFFTKLRRNEKGATAIEYGLIAALIAVVAIPGLQALGPKIQGTFQSASDKMPAAN